ncbi:hypothetical protein KSP39_PZI003675 [Platanthera zijinensis]|uniref:Uncharacterized protein n=1 Tax=Platanthera zijinensis TaxID=2320716 RepID=A0AAP0BVL1_9ASPA
MKAMVTVSSTVLQQIKESWTHNVRVKELIAEKERNPLYKPKISMGTRNFETRRNICGGECSICEDDPIPAISRWSSQSSLGYQCNLSKIEKVICYACTFTQASPPRRSSWSAYIEVVMIYSWRNIILVILIIECVLYYVPPHQYKGERLMIWEPQRIIMFSTL